MIDLCEDGHVLTWSTIGSITILLQLKASQSKVKLYDKCGNK